PETFMSKLEAYRMRGTTLPDVRAEQATLDKTVEKLHEQEKALLGCQLEGFYAPRVLAEKKRELEALRRQTTERRIELRKRQLAEEQRSTTISSAASLYETIRERLESPTYATKAQLYKLL